MPPSPDSIAMCQACGVKAQAEGEITIIGVNLAKNVFQLHEAVAGGSVVFRK